MVVTALKSRKKEPGEGARTAPSTGHASVEWIMGRYFTSDTVCIRKYLRLVFSQTSLLESTGIENKYFLFCPNTA